MDEQARTTRKSLVLWLLVFVLFGALYKFVERRAVSEQPFDQLSEDLASGRVESIEVRLSGTNGIARVQLRSKGPTADTVYETRPMPIREFLEMYSLGAPVTFSSPERTTALEGLLPFVPTLFVVLFAFFLIRALLKSQSGNPRLDELMNPRFEPIKVEPGTSPVRDLTEARASLLAAMEAVKKGEPGPRRILLSGLPGSGKTTLVRTLAAETGLPLIATSGPDYTQVYAGVGAARIRCLFERGAAAAPCIALIEDVDAFAFKRTLPNEQDREGEARNTLLELCNRLDGLRPYPERLLFIATTNRPDLLDQAFARPGRIELRVELDADGSSRATRAESAAA